MITYEIANKIFKTLPVGYYIGKNIKHTLDDSDSSYFDPMNEEIHIGYKTIEKTFDESLSTDLENDLRTLFYHEISHVILTPRCMTVDKITNIFEDERIETILSNYYMGVNFKDFCKRLNRFDASKKPSTHGEMYYNVVRFRHGPEKFVSRVERIIEKYSILNFSSVDNVNDYTNEVYDLYFDIANDFDENSQSNDDKNSRSNDDNMSNLKIANLENLFVDSAISNTSVQSNFDAKTFILNTVSTATSKYVDKNMIADMEKILSSIVVMNKHNGSAINAYSGTFDARALARDDYKFFVRQNRLGNAKQFSKIKLNLFIDRSGSFQKSEMKANQMLYALTQFEKKNSNFCFDLITCGVGQTIHKKDERFLCCLGTNRLDDKIFDQFNQVQNSQMHNINIVMFDGDAFTDCGRVWTERFSKNFGAFNHSNTVIISDSANKSYIEKYAPFAKMIITDDYVNELYRHVVNSLLILVK